MGNFKVQVKAIWGMVISPKKTITELPSDKFYLVALLLPFLLIFPRLLPHHIPADSPAYGQGVGVVHLLLWIGVFYLISAFMIKTIAEILRRKMTYIKALNIGGYCQAPRILYIVAVSIVDLLIPALRKSPDLARTLNLLAIIIALYSFGLMAYAIKICTRTDSN